MLNSGNNDREQNCLLLSPRVKRTQSDWRATNPWVSKMVIWDLANLWNIPPPPPNRPQLQGKKGSVGLDRKEHLGSWGISITCQSIRAY
jgi:hypothetical protein